MGKEFICAISARKEFQLNYCFINLIRVGATGCDERVWGRERHVLRLEEGQGIKPRGLKTKFLFPVFMNSCFN